MKNFKCILALFCYCFISFNTHARQKTTTLDSVHFKVTSWSSMDGVSGTLISVYQDVNGYLWMGSYDGLFRFDGTIFTNYNTFNTPSLPSNRVRAIVGDRNGNLWVGTGNGLVELRDGIFTNLAGEHNFYIESLLLDEKNKKLLVGTRDVGLFEYDIEKNTYKKIEKSSNDLVSALVLDTLGGIWIGSERNGLTYIKGATWKHFGEEDGLMNNEILSLTHHSNGALYVGTTSGLYKYQDSQFVKFNTFDGLAVYRIQLDLQGKVWVATSFGVYRQTSDDTWSHLSRQNGITNNLVMDLCLGTEGSIWLATYRGGLNQLRATKFVNLSVNQGLDVEAVGAIHELSDHTMLIGSTDGKLFQLTNGVSKPFPIRTELRTRISSILQDTQRNIWITSYDGLLLVTPDGREKLFTEKDGLPTRLVRLIYQDRKKQFWIGTRNSGLVKMKIDKSLRPSFEQFKYNEFNQLNSTFIMTIEEDEAGNFLIGANTGGLLILSEDGSIRHYSKEQGLVAAAALSARSDQAGNIWIATAEGVSLLEGGKFFYFSPADGLPAAGVFDIVEDHQGNCWMASSKGIIRVKKQQLLDYKNKKITTIDWKLFDGRGELENSECIAAALIVKKTDGTIWFPMRSGAVMLEAKTLMSNTRTPNVFIESTFIDKQEFVSMKELVIPPGHQRVVFHYAALSLDYPNSVRYKYKLAPFDKDWIDAGKERQAVYTSLPSGNYTFQVIACNNDGVWNTEGATLAIVKQPFFYQTWWFYAIVIVGIGVSIFFYVRIKIAEAKQKASMLELEVNKRTYQLKQKTEALEEQNREKTGMMNVVAHDLKAPLNNIKGLMGLMTMNVTSASEQRQYFQYIERSLEQGNSLIRDLLDMHSVEHEESKLELSEVDLIKILTDRQQQMSGLLMQKNQHLELTVDLVTPKVTTDEYKLIRVLDNLLTNATKFSENDKTIYLRAWQNQQTIHIAIRDEGPGISEEDQKKLFKRFQKLSARPTAGESSTGLGLSIIKVLVEKMGGSIVVNSKLGSGTEFEVRLPQALPV